MGSRNIGTYEYCHMREQRALQQPSGQRPHTEMCLATEVHHAEHMQRCADWQLEQTFVYENVVQTQQSKKLTRL